MAIPRRNLKPEIRRSAKFKIRLAAKRAPSQNQTRAGRLHARVGATLRYAEAVVAERGESEKGLGTASEIRLEKEVMLVLEEGGWVDRDCSASGRALRIYLAREAKGMLRKHAERIEIASLIGD